MKNDNYTTTQMNEDLKISNLVFKLNFSKYRYLKDDMIQEALIALSNAREKFIPEFCSYSTFAFKVAKNAMCMFLRREIKSEFLPYDDSIFQIEDNSTPVDFNIEFQDFLNDLLDKCKQKDKEKMQQAFLMLAAGYSVLEIINKIEMSSAGFYKKLRKIKSMYAGR